jgi:PhzF family phenazine biosynthesis protein
MGIPIVQVDAFASKPFSGNAAAVCLLPGPAGERWMQDLAAEMNLSETAFLHREQDDFRLRWFTPAVEVDLCGHATLASAHVLWELGILQENEPARFQTRSGLLTAQREGDWIEADFPAKIEEPAAPPAGLATALGVKPKYVGKNQFDYFIEVESEEVLRGMQPDFEALATIPVRGTIVTTAGSAPYDFVSRFFAPAAGVNEDPVTGSAHCCLGPFWKKRLGKEELLGFQASRRGGVVRVRVRGPRVVLGGQTITIFKGDLSRFAEYTPTRCASEGDRRTAEDFLANASD